MKEFFDAYLVGSFWSTMVVVFLYAIFVGTLVVRYLMGVYKGKWELEDCGTVAINLFKGMAFGLFLAVFVGLITFCVYPVIILIVFVSSLHPDFRKRVGERFVHMNKKSALRYVFFAVPIILFVTFIELVDCADECLDENISSK